MPYSCHLHWCVTPVVLKTLLYWLFVEVHKPRGCVGPWQPAWHVSTNVPQPDYIRSVKLDATTSNPLYLKSSTCMSSTVYKRLKPTHWTAKENRSNEIRKTHKNVIIFSFLAKKAQCKATSKYFRSKRYFDKPEK